ncbi:hypothetical protein [Sporosarcina sp. P33]|uniref:hypothetical protein n=1 Tax=Sporosarcina sp. P33 TaxID=1930764 RepID=UPI0009BECB76|nr:hypothetical protein [Sporosarcina sp. P33]ARD47576.1 hypothetical protein SporoP33_04535 [Sporosarcina sp. P33]
MAIDKESKDVKKSLKVERPVPAAEPSVLLPEEKKLAEKNEGAVELTQRIYVGPNMPELPKYTVVEDGYTPHIEGIIGRCPAVDKMFVKIPDMNRVETRSAEAGTRQHRDYNLIVKYMTGKDE